MNTEINEIRYYLGVMKGLLSDMPEGMSEGAPDDLEIFKPTYLVTAVKLPTGAIELSVNNTNIAEKIEYILEAYDENMHLKSNPDIVMQQIMVV